MNKTQLVDALAARIGDRRTAATAVDGLLETIVDTVKGGNPVSITGFGVFEARARAARVARNPRTGETVQVAATTVPAFRPGAGFRTAVGGAAGPAPRATPTRRPATEPAAPAEKRRTAKASAGFAAVPAELPAGAKGAGAKGAGAKGADAGAKGAGAKGAGAKGTGAKGAGAGAKGAGAKGAGAKGAGAGTKGAGTKDAGAKDVASAGTPAKSGRSAKSKAGAGADKPNKSRSKA